MSRHSTRNKVSAFSEAHEIPDVDVIQETWAPTKAQFDEYKRREIELACLAQASGERDMYLFSYDTWLQALMRDLFWSWVGW